MHRVIAISLSGHARQFRLTEEAYDNLQRYLEQARARLGDDPDVGEVIGDLERSIGERLDVLAPADQVLDASQIGGVLDETGAVDPDRPAGASPTPRRPGTRRKLYRIREGQDIAGVCTGLAAYSEIDVDWVRFIFMVLAVFTAGIFLLVYVGMAFALPIVETREDWVKAQADEARGT